LDIRNGAMPEDLNLSEGASLKRRGHAAKANVLEAISERIANHGS
jgi:hypothetical protein